jgi:hypothetical protein
VRIVPQLNHSPNEELMQRVAMLTLAVLASPLAAQSNTVPGLDGRLSVVDSLTYWGRRGAAYPGGEVGMSMLNEMCNPGTVNIPWYAAMQPNHPKFGFIITRESGGRMVQISDYSFCKHAFTSTNYSGACGSCISPGTGSLMGVRCSDTYGAGNNADRTWLGPATELDPWLGTWNPVGSYFDVGDPLTGTGPADGVRSLNTAGFDAVRNRVTVRETELNVAGARYFYGIHLMHEGESVLNRGDNLASRGFNPSWNGSSWSFGNNAVGQVYGSILQHWTGATLNSARNGNDNGTFYVAVKVTPLGGGNYHYEWAVHNADNSRGAATFRVPVDPAAVVTNVGFRDIDTNALNDWTGARAGNEFVWSAGANNALNWNSIYNFWFDCNFAPSNVPVLLGQARPGAGQPDVQVISQGPSGGLPLATLTSVGQPCGQTTCQSSIYEFFPPSGFDLQNARMTMTFSGGSYTVDNSAGTYTMPTGSTLPLTDDSQASISLPFSFPYPGGTTSTLWVCSNGFVSVVGGDTSYTPTTSAFLGGIMRWAALWHDLNPGSGGQVRVDSSASVVRVTFVAVPNFSGGGTATFQFQFYPNGNVIIVWQAVTSAGNDYLVGYTPGNGAADPGSSNLSTSLSTPVSLCNTPPYTGIVLNASARPVLGTSVNLVTSNIAPGTGFGVLVMSLTQAIPPTNLGAVGMTGCEGHVVGGVNFLYVAPGSSAQTTWAIPANTAYTGVPVIAQSFMYSPPRTPLGIIASNGLVMVLGQL